MENIRKVFIGSKQILIEWDFYLTLKLLAKFKQAIVKFEYIIERNDCKYFWNVI